MITAVGLDVPETGQSLSFRRPPLSERSGDALLVAMGDPVVGPLVGLFFDAPSTPEQLAGPPSLAPPHGHAADTFRVVMKGELWVGQARYHHGEFRLQRSGRPYGRDGDAPHVEGNWRVIFFADRRGHRVRPTDAALRAGLSTPDALEELRATFGAVLPVVLDPDDPGVDGMVTTIDTPFSRLGHVDASFAEADGWEALGPDIRLAVTLMGAHDVGPVVVVQRTAPGALATPDLAVGDLFRCVVAGTAVRASGTDQMGDVRFLGGTGDTAVHAGPDGLDELLIVGDRTALEPHPTVGDGAGGAAWPAWLAVQVAGLSEHLPVTASP